MPDKKRTFGQFDTPPDVADLLLGLCLRHPAGRVLDPSCGNGAFLQRALRWQEWLAGETFPGRLWGIELDVDAAQTAQNALPKAHILHQNFFTLAPDAPFDAIVGNPPYTRAEWIGRLADEAGEQLTMFADEGMDTVPEKQPVIPAGLWGKGISRRAGLHTYFFLHGERFLREGGRFGFVVPNNWLDVAYGEGLKQFLLDHFKVVALVESTIERWFSRAKVNTCLVVLEKCTHPAGRASNLVRFVQLRRPLNELIPYAPDHRGRFGHIERLTARLLPGRDRTTEALRVRVVSQGELRAEKKWGILWRAPAVVERRRRQRHLVPLKTWAAVQRGYTTGANSFFYLDGETVEEWGIEPAFRHPLLKSLRAADRLHLAPAGCEHEVLAVPPGAALAGTGAAAYVAWGEKQGLHRRRTCAARHPWYALPAQEPAPLVVPKGIWRRHLAPLLADGIRIDQQLYAIRPEPGVSLQVAAALLNSAWLALQLELYGRVNFGEGVLWLAGYELENVRLPDPRYLPREQVARLEERFDALAFRPVGDVVEELTRPDRQALDDAVFAVMGFTPTEAAVIRDTLLERITTREIRAATPY